MKIRLAAAFALFGASLVPLTAHSQDAQPRSAIVVTAEHQAGWDRGNRQEAQGLEDLAKAEQNLVRRSADVVNYRNRRDTSADRAENAQRTFENLTANTVFADPREAHRWAGQLERATGDWQENTNRRNEADRDLERALRRQTNSQAEVSEAQSKIDEGRAMMAQAERASTIVSRR